MSEIACPLCVGVLDDECTECFGRGVISGPKQLFSSSKDAEFYGLNLPGEEWKPYPKWEQYHISNRGRVLNTETGRLLKVSRNSDGFAVLKLKPVGKPIVADTLHRLVAQLFLPGYIEDLQVVFKDGDNNNFSVSNLEQTERRVRGKGKKAA